MNAKLKIYFHTALVLITILVSNNSISQTVLHWNNPLMTEGSDIAVDDDGNAYVLGTSAFIDQHKKFITLKYDANSVSGNDPVWVRNLTSEHYSPFDRVMFIETDINGNVFELGLLDDALIVVKYTSNGNLIGTYVFPYWIIPEDMKIDKNNNMLYFTGIIGQGVFNGLITVRFNMLTNTFAFNISTTGNAINYGKRIAFDTQGNVIVAGWVSTASNEEDFAIIKYVNPTDSPEELTPAWTPNIKTYDGGEYERATSISIDENNNDIYTSGAVYSAGNGYTGILTVRFNSNGELEGFGKYTNGFTDNYELWKTFTQVGQQDEGIFVTGTFNNPGSLNDIVTIKYDSLSGNSNTQPSKIKSFGRSSYPNISNPPGPFSDIASGMTFNTNGYLYVGGSSYSISHDQDFCVLKYDRDLNLICKSFYNHGDNDALNKIAPGINGSIFAAGTSNGLLALKYSGKCKKIEVKFRTFYSPDNQTSDNIDTATVELRSAVSPYDLITSFTGQMTVDGLADAELCAEELEASQNFYIVVKTRNTIETWSANPQHTTADTLFYDFTSSASQAFGNNMQHIGNEWVLYSGDINQDGIVDLTDVTLIDNDAYNFMKGDLTTDLNGDDFIDLSDMTTADNNVLRYVSVIRP